MGVTGLGLVLPGTVFNLDHDHAVLDAQVVRGRHGEHAMRARHALGLLQRIAQGGAELGRAWLRLLQSRRHGSLQHLARIPGVTAKGRGTALAEFGLITVHIGHGRLFTGCESGS